MDYVNLPGVILEKQKSHWVCATQFPRFLCKGPIVMKRLMRNDMGNLSVLSGRLSGTIY